MRPKELVDLVLSWLRVVSRPKPVPRRYPRVACPVCGLVVAESALSPTRHKCVQKSEVTRG